MAKTYDIGNGEQLTVRQIHDRFGLKVVTLNYRIRNGKTGKNLIAPARHQRSNKDGRKYDVGNDTHLTIAQIAEKVNCSENSIHSRIKSGLRGVALLAPSKNTPVTMTLD